MNKNNSTILIYLIFASFLNLIITFMIKYDLNSLPISSFNLFYIGNLIPIFLEVVFLIFVLGHLLSKKSIKLSHKMSLFILSFSALVLLFLSYLIVKSNYQFTNEYVFNYPIKKVLVGSSLLLAFIIEIYIITLLLNLFFNKSFIVYLKSFVATMLILIISFGAIFAFTTKHVYNSKTIKPSRNAIGVVLGAAVWHNSEPSPIFKGRIDKANELIKSKSISKIQLTGSNAPGEVSEARTAFKYASKKGIKKHLLALEEKTTTTTEQIKFIKKEISNNRKYSSILIISDQFHLTRVLEISKFFNVKAVGVASDYNLNWEKLLYYRFRESVALLFFWLFAI